jgi:paraquat-inducible protein A
MNRKSETIDRERLVRCPICDAVNYDAGETTLYCHRCASEIPRPNRAYIGRTWALLLTSILLYIPANIYPILRIKNLFYHSDNTVIGGVILLWDKGSYFVATVVAIASVIIPILKFILLLYLLISTYYPVASSRATRRRFHFITEAIGAWAMVDVFVVTTLAGLVHMDIFWIVPGTGATAYVLMVFFTMLTALSFDPRWLIEGHHEKRSSDRESD